MEAIAEVAGACVGAAVASALHFVVPLVRGRRNGKAVITVTPRDGENGTAGLKSVSFWENKMEDAIEEGVGRAFRGRNEQIREVFRQENQPLYDRLDKMLEKQDNVLEKVNDLILEVIKGRTRG